MDESTHLFETHRDLLEGIAYRMCGILADAQDIVQETYLRWRRIDPATIREPRAWLVTTCSRIALDLLKSAQAHREAYYGTWLPEPLLGTSTARPDVQARIDDTVSMALMLALEKLTPAERAAFLLHEVFGYSFDEIAVILRKTESACRKLASRARTAVRDDRPRFEATPDDHRRLLEAFFQAAHAGKIEDLKSLLSESVQLHSDGGGYVVTTPEVLHGSADVSKFFARVWGNHPAAQFEMAVRWFNGSPGLVLTEKGRTVVAISLTVDDGKITGIYALRNPEKLTPFRTPKPASGLNHQEH